MAIFNVTRCGFLSFDRALRGYCEDLWNVTPAQGRRHTGYGPFTRLPTRSVKRRMMPPPLWRVEDESTSRPRQCFVQLWMHGEEDRR